MHGQSIGVQISQEANPVFLHLSLYPRRDAAFGIMGYDLNGDALTRQSKQSPAHATVIEV